MNLTASLVTLLTAGLIGHSVWFDELGPGYGSGVECGRGDTVVNHRLIGL